MKTLKASEILNSETKVLNIEILREAKMWYQADRIFGRTDTSVSDYYREIVQFQREQKLEQSKIPHKKTYQ